MPRHPDVSTRSERLSASVYSALVGRVHAQPGPVYPFHVGDTWMEPATGCRMQDLSIAEHPGLHRYGPVQGRADLRAAIAAQRRRRTGLDVQADDILVTAGATSGLGITLGALVDPGDEVLILAPHWPLIAGMVHGLSGKAVTVPFLGAVQDAAQAVAAVEVHRTPRTVALYVNTPNNPTGCLLPADWLRALAAWARQHDLWLLADEVYEDYVYDGVHTAMRTLAPDRTVSVHSFSKAYGMAGNRAGYLVGPRALLRRALRFGVHSAYSAPTAAQVAALRALGAAGDDWLAQAARRYAEIGREAAAALGVSAPQGSTFLWLDVASHLGAGGLTAFLERAGDRGLLLAPGPSFGPYPTHVRVCFTAAPPDITARGVAALADLLERPNED